MRNSTFTRMLLALVPCLALVLGAQLTWPSVARWHHDISIYAGYADQLVRGAVPYRDFRPEYPPLALLPFVVPRLLVLGQVLTEDQYRLLFLLQSTLYCWITTFVMLLVAGDSRVLLIRISVWMTILVGILSPFLPWRFDMFPTMLTALALLAWTRRQSGLLGAWLGFGVAAKLYPVVLGPLFVVQAAFVRRWRQIIWLMLGGMLALVFSILPFYLVARDGLFAFLAYHAQRGIQIESTPGGVVLLGHIYGLTSVSIKFNYGALHLVSPWANAMLPWLMPAFVVAYVAVMAMACIVFQKRANRPGLADIAALCVAAMLVFIVTNKVFSPQYLAWLLPFVVLLRLRQIIVFAAICLVTVIIFPFNYDALLSLEPWAVLLLNIRNLGMFALLILVLAEPWQQDVFATAIEPPRTMVGQPAESSGHQG